LNSAGLSGGNEEAKEVREGKREWEGKKGVNVGAGAIVAAVVEQTESQL